MRSITRYFCAVCCTAVLAGCKGGPAPDFSGQWAEKSAERVVAVFAPAAEGGYRVQAGWRETGLAQYEAWDMSTKPGKGGALTYSDGCLERFSFEREGDTEYVEEIVYTDGAGSFRINRKGELVWKDATDEVETVFIRVDLNGDDAAIIAPELTGRVLELCRYIPDHGLLPEASGYMTEDFFKALSDAFAKPAPDDGTIDDYEWLYTFVTGNGGALPAYSVESVHRADRSHATAVIGVRDVWEPGGEPSGELSLHQMDLVLKDGHWLIADFDGHKQDCHFDQGDVDHVAGRGH